jgi:hypothetical protein
MDAKQLTALIPQVESLYNDGMTDEEIAAKLKQNVVQVMSIRKMLGLYKRMAYFDPTTQYKIISKDNEKGQFNLYVQIRKDLMDKLKMDIKKRYRYLLELEKGKLIVHITEAVE